MVVRAGLPCWLEQDFHGGQSRTSMRWDGSFLNGSGMQGYHSRKPIHGGGHELDNLARCYGEGPLSSE